MANNNLEIYKSQLNGFLELAKDAGDIKENNIECLKDFNFENLKNKNKYGCKSIYRVYSSKKDNDSSRLARIIYYILWGNHKYKTYRLQNLYDAEKEEGCSFYAGDDKYGGDTLITNKIFTGNTTIGNFMILPKGKVPYGKGTTTLNQYKGINPKVKDNLYVFINIIKKLYKHEQIDDNIWNELFDNEDNKDFFIAKSEGEEGFKKFLKFYMLENWEELKEGNAEKFVKERGKKICEKLKKRLKT